MVINKHPLHSIMENLCVIALLTCRKKYYTDIMYINRDQVPLGRLQSNTLDKYLDLKWYLGHYLPHNSLWASTQLHAPPFLILKYPHFLKWESAYFHPSFMNIWVP